MAKVPAAFGLDVRSIHCIRQDELYVEYSFGRRFIGQ